MSKFIDPEWLGKRLREVRKERNLTLREVADEIEISVPTLSRIERGEYQNLKSGTLLVLSDWMKTAIRFHRHTPVNVETKSATTPQIVKLHLRADKKLSPKAAKHLSYVFQSMYENLTNERKKR